MKEKRKKNSIFVQHFLVYLVLKKKKPKKEKENASVYKYCCSVGMSERAEKKTDAVFRNQLNAFCSKDTEQMRNK